MKTLDAEVIVVGGGPAGAATATHLARAGRDVLLLDKASFPREKACAEYLSPGTVGLLDRLGVLPAVAAASPAWLDGFRVGTAHAGYRLVFSPSASPYRGMGIPRVTLDHLLLEHAARAGARVEQRTPVQGVLVDDGRVVGVRLRGGGRERTLRAHFVVGADGNHSVTARSLGLDIPVRWPRRLGLVARYQAACGNRDTGVMLVGPGAYCGIAPVGNGLVNVGLVVPLGSKPAREPTARFFERRWAEVPGARDVLDGASRVTPVRGVGPLAKRVSRSAGPGYLLVGDAAGFLDPFTGEGIHRALRGAELASEALGAALERGSASPAGYERSRQMAFRDKERLCWLVQGFLAIRPLFGYAVERVDRRQRLADTLSGILGDLTPAAPALHPRFLWALLRP